MKSLTHQKQTLFVSLGCQIDMERFIQFSKNVQIEELLKPNDFAYFQINDLKEASLLCSKFISFYNLGSSNWTGGRIIDNENNFIAHVSYNGRVWDDFNYPCNEIEI